MYEIIDNDIALIFQSTRPMRDATVSVFFSLIFVFDFNPRVPCGTRPVFGCYKISHQFIISIHASHAGRDRGSCDSVASWRISIHASHAGRDIGRISTLASLILFQSTRPMRDATVSNISVPSAIIYFNPRVPCGTRRYR